MAGSGKKRILFVVQHRFNRAPGQRYRCEQYIKYLETNGFECAYSPLIVSQQEDFALYNSESLLDKAKIFTRGLARRVKDVWSANSFDIIYIYREAFLAGPAFFEKLFRRSKAKIIVDFDDAIWLHSVSQVNKSLQWLKSPGKINDIITLSDLVITGNSFLAGYAKAYNANVTVFPSTIDLDYYKVPVKQKAGENEAVVIGWSGSHTTVEHFETIIPVLRVLKKKYGSKLKFAVYGDPFYKNEELEIQGTAWDFDTEVATISSFDIGIMPLPLDDWSRGKCSMKGLQYMGLEVPAVLSSIGMNLEVIEDGVNGFLANDENDWVTKLSLLIENKDLRERIGKAGRKTVEERFSSQALHPAYLHLFQNVLTTQRGDRQKGLGLQTG